MRLKSMIRNCAVLLLGVLFVSGCTAEIHETEESSHEEEVAIEQISIQLPEEYYIEMSVENRSGFGTVKTSYALSQKEGWYYIKQGYDREQYVFRPVADDKYIIYQYDTAQNKYIPTMISEALKQQIEAGQVSLESLSVSKTMIDSVMGTLDTYFFGHKTLTSALSYKGKEMILGRECAKFSGTVDTVGVKSDLEFWIDLETGLVMRSVNKTKTGLLRTTQTNEITVFSEEGQIPSAEEY